MHGPKSSFYGASEDHPLQCSSACRIGGKIDVHEVRARLIDASKRAILILYIVNTFGESTGTNRIDRPIGEVSIHPRRLYLVEKIALDLAGNETVFKNFEAVSFFIFCKKQDSISCYLVFLRPHHRIFIKTKHRVLK